MDIEKVLQNSVLQEKLITVSNASKKMEELVKQIGGINVVFLAPTGNGKNVTLLNFLNYLDVYHTINVITSGDSSQYSRVTYPGRIINNVNSKENLEDSLKLLEKKFNEKKIKNDQKIMGYSLIICDDLGKSTIGANEHFKKIRHLNGSFFVLLQNIKMITTDMRENLRFLIAKSNSSFENLGNDSLKKKINLVVDKIKNNNKNLNWLFIDLNEQTVEVLELDKNFFEDNFKKNSKVSKNVYVGPPLFLNHVPPSKLKL